MGKAQKKNQTKAPDELGPTPEWLARYGEHKTSPTTSSGFKMGRTYLREPWFESLVKRDQTDARRENRRPQFSDDDLQALRFYRGAFEAANRSETKCCLASMVHGSGGGNGEPSLAVARARSTLASVEALLGPLLPTMRAIALEDQPYAQVAMARFGSRQQDWFDDASGTFTVKIVPKSGRHATVVRDEFVAGVRRLTAAVNGQGAMPRAANEAGEPVQPRVSISQIVSESVDRHLASGKGIASIVIAERTLLAIAAEEGRDVDPHRPLEAQFPKFCGHPLLVHEAWEWGWVVNEPQP